MRTHHYFVLSISAFALTAVLNAPSAMQQGGSTPGQYGQPGQQYGQQYGQSSGYQVSVAAPNAYSPAVSSTVQQLSSTTVQPARSMSVGARRTPSNTSSTPLPLAITSSAAAEQPRRASSTVRRVPEAERERQMSRQNPFGTAPSVTEPPKPVAAQQLQPRPVAPPTTPFATSSTTASMRMSVPAAASSSAAGGSSELQQARARFNELAAAADQIVRKRSTPKPYTPKELSEAKESIEKLNRAITELTQKIAESGTPRAGESVENATTDTGRLAQMQGLLARYQKTAENAEAFFRISQQTKEAYDKVQRLEAAQSQKAQEVRREVEHFSAAVQKTDAERRAAKKELLSQQSLETARQEIEKTQDVITRLRAQAEAESRAGELDSARAGTSAVVRLEAAEKLLARWETSKKTAETYLANKAKLEAAQRELEMIEGGSSSASMTTTREQEQRQRMEEENRRQDAALAKKLAAERAERQREELRREEEEREYARERAEVMRRQEEQRRLDEIERRIAESQRSIPSSSSLRSTSAAGLPLGTYYEHVEAYLASRDRTSQKDAAYTKALEQELTRLRAIDLRHVQQGDYIPYDDIDRVVALQRVLRGEPRLPEMATSSMSSAYAEAEDGARSSAEYGAYPEESRHSIASSSSSRNSPAQRRVNVLESTQYLSEIASTFPASTLSQAVTNYVNSGSGTPESKRVYWRELEKRLQYQPSDPKYMSQSTVTTLKTQLRDYDPALPITVLEFVEDKDGRIASVPVPLSYASIGPRQEQQRLKNLMSYDRKTYGVLVDAATSALRDPESSTSLLGALHNAITFHLASSMATGKYANESFLTAAKEAKAHLEARLEGVQPCGNGDTRKACEGLHEGEYPV